MVKVRSEFDETLQLRRLQNPQSIGRWTLRGGVALMATLGALWVAPSGQGLAWAQDSSTSATPRALLLQVDAGNSGLDPQAIRAAIAQELGVPVALASGQESGAGMLSVKVVTGRRLIVRYQGGQSGGVERTMILPREADRSIETIALLSGNLVRNEAQELLASLRKPEPEPAAPIVTAPPASSAPKAAEAPKAPPTASSAPAASAPPPVVSPKASGEPEKVRVPAASVPINLSLFHPISLDPHSEQKRYGVELGLAYSRVGAVHGLGANPLILQIDHDLEGVAFAGGIKVGGPVQGVLGAHLGSITEGSLYGAAFAGLGNLSYGTVQGGQASGVLNVSKGKVQGVQFAGVLNYGSAPIQGMQSATVNWVDSSVEGFQAGVVNGVRSLEGAQLGVFNYASQSASGLQIGVVNMGGKTRGFQLGVVNVDDEVKGFSLGLVSYAKKGRLQPVAWYSNEMMANVGIKSMPGGPIYTLLGYGWDPDRGIRDRDPNRDVWGGFFAIGGHIPVGQFFADADVGYSYEQTTYKIDSGNADRRSLHVIHYRAMLGYEVVPKVFGLFAGGGLRQELSGKADHRDYRPEFIGGVQFF